MNCITVTKTVHINHIRNRETESFFFKWHLERKRHREPRTATERHVRYNMSLVRLPTPPHPLYKPTVVNGEILFSVEMTNKLAARLGWQERCESALASLTFIYVARHAVLETELAEGRTG